MAEDDKSDATIHDLRDRLNAAICAASGRGASQREAKAFEEALAKARAAETESQIRDAIDAMRALCP